MATAVVIKILVWIVIIVLIEQTTEVGGKPRRESDSKLSRERRSSSEDMVIFEGKDIGILNGMFNTPYFDKDMKTNHTVQVGHSIKLPCIVRQIGSKIVSWIRKSDSAILSVDDMLVTYSDRMSIQKIDYLSEWGLVINPTVPNDSGQYECQVSSEPKLSRTMQLTVQVPVLWIEGSPSILSSQGSNISLACRVRGPHSPGLLDSVVWQHETAEGILRTLAEEKGRVVQTGPGSWTLIKVDLSSAGNYSCSTHQSNTATVAIIVVQGDLTPEAMLEVDLKGYTSSQVMQGPGLPLIILLSFVFNS